jgi:serine/threonine protein kinase
MQAQLVIIAGPDKGRAFPLTPGATLQVGRSQSTPTRLTDPAVSRVHCEVEADGALVTVHDRSSTGTYVNGHKITKQQLQPGDVIHVGNTDLRYTIGDPDATTLSPSAPKLAAEAGEPLTALVGQTLSHYAIEQALAKGATGTVFRARDTGDGKTVALKVLQPEFSQNDDEMQRFVRAMKTTLNLRHPNLVALFAAGKTGPYCWMAMEYVDGESMTEVIKRIGVAGMLEVRYAYRVAVHVARALEYAHGQSIIHRNVTPQNLLVRHADKLVKLGDLMLAKALEGTLAMQITRPGELVGEIAYLSPERTRGPAGADARSDLYGLGATLYALLTGHPPFAGESLPDLITKIRTAEPEKPKKFQMAIPDAFQSAVLRLLAKRPEDRFQTAAALLAELERVGKFAGLTA